MYLKRVEKIIYHQVYKFQLNEENFIRLNTALWDYLGDETVKLTTQDIIDAFQYNQNQKLNREYWNSQFEMKFTLGEILRSLIEDLLYENLDRDEFVQTLE